MIHLSDTDSADNLVFAGIDWGGTHQQVCLVDRDGNIQTRKRLCHDVAGFAELDELLGIPGIRVAIERGEGLLVEHLQLRGIPVYCVSPKISARARERYRLSATKSERQRLGRFTPSTTGRSVCMRRPCQVIGGSLRISMSSSFTRAAG